MIKIQRWKPQSKILCYYVEAYFLLCSEGCESINSFELEGKDGVFVCFKKNAFINIDNNSIFICSSFRKNIVSLEIYKSFNEGIIQQRFYNGAITEIILKLNEANKHYLFSNININMGSFYIENFQFLYPSMESTINLLFCNKTLVKDKIKYLDEILTEYFSFILLNGVNSILKKNKIINAS